MNKKEKALKRQRELIALAESEQRELTAEEQSEFDSLQAEIDAAPSGEGGSGEQQPSDNGGNGERSSTGEFTPESASQIIQMCRTFGIDEAGYIERGLSVEAARSEIMEELMKRNTPIGAGISVTKDENDKFRDAVTDGILLRSGIAVKNPAEGASRYRNLSISEIATECCEREMPGHDYRHMGRDELYSESLRSFYNPTSAFPSILDDVIQKSYVEGLTKSRTTFDKWVKFGTLSNFKKTTNHEYIMSLGGQLSEIPENGELPAYVPKDVKMPERQLKTYGTQFTMTRQAFIDDDIGLLTSMPRRYAEMSQRTQNNIIYGILLKNKKIHDGKNLFHADHNNTLETGTGVTIAAIKKMIYMIGIQKDAADNQLALMPDLFIVPFGMGAEVQTILGSPTIHTAENTQAVNPYATMNFTVVEDVTLNTLAGKTAAVPWFMGVKGEIIQVDYLNGQKEANIRRSEKPGTLGFVWDVYHDFGISVLHHETICRNPGIIVTGE